MSQAKDFDNVEDNQPLSLRIFAVDSAWSHNLYFVESFHSIMTRLDVEH